MSSAEDNTNIQSPNEESRASFLYQQKDFTSARIAFEKSLKFSANNDERKNILFNIATCVASEGEYQKAINLMEETNSPGNDLVYNRSLCYYKLSRYKEALDLLNKLISDVYKRYPELKVPKYLEKVDESVGSRWNDFSDSDQPGLYRKLEDSCLNEALNLKAAILWELNDDLETENLSESIQILNQIPIKKLEHIDCVTLHNFAIFDNDVKNLDSNIDKLEYLSNKLIRPENDREDSIESFVPEVSLRNLLVLMIQNQQHDEALGFLQECKNKNKVGSLLSREMVKYIEIQIVSRKDSDEVRYKQFDKLLNEMIDELKLSGNSSAQSNASAKRLKELKDLSLSVTTHMGRILWKNNQYRVLEGLLVRVSRYFKDYPVWVKSVAHTLFMLDTRYENCCQFYEELLPSSVSEGDDEDDFENEDQRLDSVDPMVLSNLCVSYVLTGRNSDAESLIKDVEELVDDPKTSSGDNVSKQSALLCIINLVIGTLYCVKYNYGFGLARIFRSLEPLESNLNARTWFHVKRCILFAINNHCKQMICMKDEIFDQTIAFLILCEEQGAMKSAQIPIESQDDKEAAEGGDKISRRLEPNSISYEARYLRYLILRLLHE